MNTKSNLINDELKSSEISDDSSMVLEGMWWKHLIAGGIAGSVSRTCTAPLDRIKIFLQVRGSEFNGLRHCFLHMIQEGGVKSMWRGNGINVLKIAPENALKFMTYDQAKQIIRGNSNREICFAERFASGSFAGGFSQTVIYPMEVLKTRLCLRMTGQYKGIIDAIRKIYGQGGVRAFYRGYVPNLVGIIFYAGIDLALYEKIKKQYINSQLKDEEPEMIVYLICGLLSSSCGQLATYPFSLVRTRLQANSNNPEETMRSAFKKIMKEQGIFGFYRGIMPNFIKVAPSAGITYIVYEKARSVLGADMT